jgi:hypothetical protein
VSFQIFSISQNQLPGKFVASKSHDSIRNRRRQTVTDSMQSA